MTKFVSEDLQSQGRVRPPLSETAFSRWCGHPSILLVFLFFRWPSDGVSAQKTNNCTIFPGDMGSYLGLLMGCSILTMIEIIDLFLYHSIVKLIEYLFYDRPRRRVVRDVDPKEMEAHDGGRSQDDPGNPEEMEPPDYAGCAGIGQIGVQESEA